MTTDPDAQIGPDGSMPAEEDADLRQPGDELIDDPDTERMHTEDPAEGLDDPEMTGTEEPLRP